MAAAAASVAKMPSLQDHSPSPQLFYGVKNSTKLTKPAIFLSWNDCKPFVGAEQDFRCFHSIVDAVKYVCNNDDLMKQLSEAVSLNVSSDKKEEGPLKRPAKQKNNRIGEKKSEEDDTSPKSTMMHDRSSRAACTRKELQASAASTEVANSAKTSSGTLKRKRGRPRKVVVEETSQKVTVSGQDSNVKRKRGRPKKVVAENGKKKAVTLVDESPKRKRGRPKKVVAEETNAPDQKEKAAEKESTAPKKKRGRPRKLVDTETGETTQATCPPKETSISGPQQDKSPGIVATDSRLQDSTSVEDTSPPKKKRGRPRKVIADETTLQEKAASNETTSPPPKKKRGRPRKAETSGAAASAQLNTAPKKKLPMFGPHISAKDMRNVQWFKMLDELKAYKQVHGNTDIPVSYPENQELARWVETQRSCCRPFLTGSKRSTSMTLERFQALTKVGFNFNLPRARIPEDQRVANKQWNLRFDELKQFKAMNGHCNVPRSGCPEFPKLQRWVSFQRSLYKRVRQGKQTTLTEERIALLNKVGFTWQVLAEMLSWEERYQQLVEYKERFGDCNVKNILEKDNAEGIPHGLGPWVSRQRQLYKKLSLGEDVEFPQEKIDQLNALGFTWQLRKRGPSMLEEPLAGPTPQEEPFFYHVQL